MDHSDAPEVVETHGSTDDGPSGGASALSLLVGIAAAALWWRQIRGAVAWWWDLTTGVGHSYGALVIFGLGMLGAAVVALMVLAALAKLLGFAGDLGGAFRNGWGERGD